MTSLSAPVMGALIVELLPVSQCFSAPSRDCFNLAPTLTSKSFVKVKFSQSTASSSARKALFKNSTEPFYYGNLL